MNLDNDEIEELKSINGLHLIKKNTFQIHS